MSGIYAKYHYKLCYYLYIYSNLPGLKFFVYCICIIMWHSHLNEMEILKTKRFIPKGLEFVRFFEIRF